MFILLGIALALGIVVGLLAGGRLGEMKRVQLRWTWLAIGSGALGMSPLFVEVSGSARTFIQITSMLGILAFLVVNLARVQGLMRVGLAIVALGWALNFAVIVANGAMPLSEWAYERSGQTDAPTPGEGGFFKIELADEDTVLRPLGDVIPIGALGRVVSVGDIVLFVGVALSVAGGMRPAGRARVRTRSRA